MMIDSRTKTTEYKVYIANDGTEFNSQRECEKHDKNLLNLTEALVITERPRGRNMAHDFVCVMSSFEKAAEWIQDSIALYGETMDNRFDVRSVFIDEHAVGGIVNGNDKQG